VDCAVEAEAGVDRAVAATLRIDLGSDGGGVLGEGPGGAGEQEAAEGGIASEAEGDVDERFAAAALLGRLPASGEGGRAPAEPGTGASDLGAAVADVQDAVAMAADHGEVDRGRAMQQDLDGGGAGEHLESRYLAVLVAAIGLVAVVGGVRLRPAAEKADEALGGLGSAAGDQPGRQNLGAAVDELVVVEAAGEAEALGVVGANRTVGMVGWAWATGASVLVPFRVRACRMGRVR
jgi:hypothetical protein